MTLILVGQLMSLAMGGLLVWGLSPWSLTTQCDEGNLADMVGWRVLTLGTALLAGVGLAGLSAWGYLLLKLRLNPPLIAIDLLVLLVLACALFLYRSRINRNANRVVASQLSNPPSSKPIVNIALRLLGGWGPLVVAGGLVTAGVNLARRPWGDWDAIMIWNARARFLERAGELWPLGFKLPIIHPDYPILLPMSVSRLWWYQNGESSFAPQVVSMTFLLAGMLMLWGTLRACRGRAIAWIGLIALIANPYYINFGSLQLADVPVGTFLMAGWALIAVAAHQRQQRLEASPLNEQDKQTAQNNWQSWTVWALAGLMFGCMAWVKNEGLMMLVATAMGLLVTRRPTTWLKRDWRLLASLAAAAAVVLTAIVWAKLMLAGSNDLIRGQSDATTAVEKILDYSRHTAIFNAYWQSIKAEPTVSSTVVLALLVPVAGWRAGRLGWTAAGMGVALVLVVAGYYTVYLLTPLDLQWHLSTSLSRLMTQVWPLFVLWAMLGLRLPVWCKGQATQTTNATTSATASA